MAAFCAPTASGQTAVPLSRVMNARRLMSRPNWVRTPQTSTPILCITAKFGRTFAYGSGSPKKNLAGAADLLRDATNDGRSGSKWALAILSVAGVNPTSQQGSMAAVVGIEVRRAQP